MCKSVRKKRAPLGAWAISSAIVDRAIFEISGAVTFALNPTLDYSDVKVRQSEFHINMFPTDDPLSGVRKLFPSLPEKDLNEVKEFLDEYLSVCWKLYERLEREKAEILDELMRKAVEKKKQENQGI